MSDFNNEAKDRDHYFQPASKRGQNQFWAGLLVIGVGVVLLLRQTGVLFPNWLFTWPSILIVVGLFSGIRHGFRRGPWFVLILVGSLFLADKVNPGWQLKNYIWPFLIIIAGLALMFRPKNRHCRNRWQRGSWQQQQPGTNEMQEIKVERDGNNFIDVTAFFGGVKKVVLSKDFKGGDVTTFMAGTEINLAQADINGTITLDATNIFGGTKLIIPPTWDVQSEIVTIFGGVDDKRQNQGVPPDPTKVVRLEGTCLFGGIEIKSY
ncbi:DUF5668 domain-containing protein [Paraflavisolibacter sp. H34]|uniref:LiaF transmembrane domain-containing protein n=1 Tax=Huijunlia imazamoxiresistens TaxID=3127457 RepID=UPI003019A552